MCKTNDWSEKHCRSELVMRLVIGLFLLALSVYAQSKKTLVENFYSAFNAHDVEKMASFVSDDINVLYINKNTVVQDVKNIDMLKSSMTSYFSSIQSARSEIQNIMISGSYVSVHEKVSWISNGSVKSQFALGVFEIRNNKICRVWYYPSEK